MELDLKRCPFCGNSAVELHTARALKECANCANEELCPEFEVADNCRVFLIVCDALQGGCGAATGYYDKINEAVKAWNKRS